MKTLLQGSLILMACVFFTTRGATANDAIIAEFGAKVAQAMCADGGAWLDAYKTPREQCPQISQSVLGPCMTKVIGGRSVPLKSEAELLQLSENLYACMKDSFLARYGSNAK
jgi:hypothetical protein